MRLHGVMILGGRLIGRFDALRGGGETGLYIAAMSRRRMAGADGWRHKNIARIQPNPRRLDVVARRQQRRAFRRGLKRFRDDDGDRLVGVSDPVVLQEIEPEHERMVFSSGSWASGVLLAGVITSTTPGWALAAATSRNVTRPRAMLLTASDRVEHPGRMVVGGVAGSPRDFENPITAGDRLSHVRAVPNVSGRLRERDLRHGRNLRKRRQRGMPEAPACARACQRLASASARTTTRRASSDLERVVAGGLCLRERRVRGAMEFCGDRRRAGKNELRPHGRATVSWQRRRARAALLRSYCLRPAARLRLIRRQMRRMSGRVL